MNIRDATKDDIEAIANIYRYYVRSNICTLEEHEPSTDTVRSEFSKVFSSNAPFIVATAPDTDDVCGYAYTSPFNERSGYSSTCEDLIYMRTDHCGKKLGKQLLQALFDRLRATSKTTQVIAKMSILPEQPVEDLSSCRLHMAFGFKPVGRLLKVGQKFNKWVDVVILQLNLESIRS